MGKARARVVSREVSANGALEFVERSDDSVDVGEIE
jgi:hypothetical protein